MKNKQPSIATLALLVTGFYSSVMLGGSVAMIVQDYRWHIPEGEVATLPERTRAGWCYKLVDGTEATLPSWVLYADRGYEPLVLGDRVSKVRNSFAYRLNGRVLTDFRWTLRTHVFESGKLVFFSVFALALLVRSLLPVFGWRPERRRSPRKALLILCGTPVLWLGFGLFAFVLLESMAAVLGLF